MKNLYIIPTDKPSRLHYSKVKSDEGISYKLVLNYTSSKCNDGLLSSQRNVYITSDENKKLKDYVYDVQTNNIFRIDNYSELESAQNKQYKKIILTTDTDLIADDVQAIDDEFLEWFVKNTSCESVEVELEPRFPMYKTFKEDIDTPPFYGNLKRKIIIPKEEPKQFSLDEDIYENTGMIIPKLPQQECEHMKEVGCIKDICTCNTGPKQESLEEAAEGYWAKQPYNEDAFIKGAKSDVARDYWFKIFKEQFKKK